MTIQSAVAMRAESVDELPLASSLVVVTTVDGALKDGDEAPCSEVLRTVRMLSDHNIPVVLVSDVAAADVIAIQECLGITAPFISDGGASLCIPRGYFGNIVAGRDEGRWTVIDCLPWGRRERAHAGSACAIRLLLCLYRMQQDDIVVVGLGCSERDRVLLREVDVPIVVRRKGHDADVLMRAFPDAYLTDGYGPVGWTEAILGSYDV